LNRLSISQSGRKLGLLPDQTRQVFHGRGEKFDNRLLFFGSLVGHFGVGRRQSYRWVVQLQQLVLGLGRNVGVAIGANWNIPLNSS
jgi:hypothetical protein